MLVQGIAEGLATTKSQQEAEHMLENLLGSTQAAQKIAAEYFGTDNSDGSANRPKGTPTFLSSSSQPFVPGSSSEGAKQKQEKGSPVRQHTNVVFRESSAKA